MEADDVVGEDPVVDLVADHRRQHPPGVRLAPRDVDEVRHERVRACAADQRRQRVEVVVVDHHDRALDPLDLLEHRARQILVDDVVAELERLGLVAADVRGVGQIPQVVLDEPQHRVGDDAVEAVVGIGVGGDQLDAVLGPVRALDRERMAAVPAGHRDVAVAHRRGDPGDLTVPREAHQRGHQAAGAALRLAVGLERHRAAVGDEDQRVGSSPSPSPALADARCRRRPRARAVRAARRSRPRSTTSGSRGRSRAAGGRRAARPQPSVTMPPASTRHSHGAARS